MAFMQVPPQALPQWLEHLRDVGVGTPAVLLDVREAWELQTASVAASSARPAGLRLLHIPMGQLPQRFSEIEADAPIAVLCHHGSRSLHAGHWLAQQGFEHLANVQGGIDAWSRSCDAAVPVY